MAIVRLVGADGEEFTVPDRLCGEGGPEIEITVCATGEFIDPDLETLRFMPMPAPPVLERLQVGTADPVAKLVDMGDVWHPTEDEFQMAREEGAEFRKLLRGYYG
jgi:hypothetical protein